MKFMKISATNVNLIFFIILIFYINYVLSINENCQDPCISCQNTLYFLKFRGDADCRFNRCQGLCMKISGEWNAYTNKNLNFFKEDKINICETCFRAGHCHINDCIFEKSIIHNAIQASVQNVKFHYLNPKLTILKNINQNSNDYVNNMDFVMLNLNKIINLFQKLDLLYHDSIRLKKIYKHLLSHITQKNNIPISDLSLNLGIDTDDDIPWKDSFQNMRIYENFFTNIKQNKISFQTGKIYLADDINKQNQIIKNISDFDDKIKILIDNAKKLIEMFKRRTNDNLAKIHKLMILTDIAYFNFVPKETKILILTGKRVLSDKDYKEILKISTKPPDLLKKITEQMNLSKKESQLSKKIEIETNMNKKALNKLNAPNLGQKESSLVTTNNNLNKVSDIIKINEAKQNLQNLSNSVETHINDSSLDNILNGLENKMPNNPIMNPLNQLNPGINPNNNLMNLLGNKPELKDLNMLSMAGAGNNEFLKNMNPGLAMNPQINSFLKDQKDLAMNSNFNTKPGSININNINNTNITSINLNKNSTTISEKSKIKDNDLTSLKEDFDDDDDDSEESENKSPVSLNKNSTSSVKSNSTIANNTSIIKSPPPMSVDRIVDFNDSKAMQVQNLNLQPQNNLLNNNLIKDNSDLLHNIRISQMNSMMPKPGLLPPPTNSHFPNAPQGMQIPMNNLNIPGNPIPLQRNLVGGMPFPHLGVPDINHLPNPFGGPMLTKSTIIGGIGMPEKNKNVFKPDIRTENLVKKLLGLDNRPKIPFNPLAMRLNPNLNNTNLNTTLNKNHTESNSTSDEKDSDDEEDEEKLLKEKEQSLEKKLSNFNPQYNTPNNNPNNLNNQAHNPTLNNLNNNNNNINLPPNPNLNGIPNGILNKNLPLRTDSSNNHHEKHAKELEEDDDEDGEDDDDSFSIKGKSDFDDMMQDNDDGYRDVDNLFLEKKENMRNRKLRNQMNSSLKNLNLKKKKSNNLRKNVSFALQNRYRTNPIKYLENQGEDLLFDSRSTNLFIEKKSSAKNTENSGDLLSILRNGEVSQEDFLKTINNYDYLNYESKDSKTFKHNSNKPKKEFLYDDEFKLQKELYQMQHNQTLIEEIKKEQLNEVKKQSIEEIKFKTKKFVENLNKNIKDYKSERDNDLKLKEQQMNKSFENENSGNYNALRKNSENLISVFSNNLKTLDEEFFEIKHNLMTSLLD